MSQLASLQAGFMAAIVGENPPASAAAAVYRRNVFATLRGALEDTYPVVRRLVGDAFMGEAARRYALAYPSTSGDLHAFGGEFGNFIDGYAPAHALAYLGDVARLEWACHESFHAADAAPLDWSALGGVSAERYGEIRFRLHPAARLLRSAHPVAAIWHANQPGRDGEIGAAAGPEHVIVRRDGGEVLVATVAAHEWDFLDAVARGAAFRAAAAAFDAPGAADGMALPAALARHVASGVIAGFFLPAAGA